MSHPAESVHERADPSRTGRDNGPGDGTSRRFKFPSGPSVWVGTLATAVAYFVAGWLGLLLAIPPGYATAIWPASGIALMVLLVFGSRMWFGVMLGSTLVNLSISLDSASLPDLAGSLAVAAAIGLGAAIQALVGAWLVRRFVGARPALIATGEIVGFLGLGGPVSCLVNSLWGTAVLVLTGVVPRLDAAFTWWTWWVGDVLGVLIVAPLVLIWLGRGEPLWRRRRVSVAMPLAILLVLVVSVFGLSNRQQMQKIELEYAHQSAAAAYALEKNLTRYLDVLRSIRDLFASSEKVTRANFQQFVSHSLGSIPGIQALSWNPYLHDDDRSRFESEMRNASYPDFTIREHDLEGKLVPASQRDEYVVVHYIEPELGNEDAIGFDVYSNEKRRVAFQRSRDSGKPVVTGRISLIQEPGGQWGVLVFWPIYSTPEAPSTLTGRRKGLRGFAVGVFRVGDVLASAFGPQELAGLVTRLYDDEAPNGERFLSEFHGEGVIAAGQNAAADGSTALPSWSRTIDIAGRKWLLVISPTADYLASRRDLASWFVLAAGLLFTGLLGGFLLELSGRAERDALRAAEMSRVNLSLGNEIAQRTIAERELYREKERAEVTLRSIGDAVITTDPKGIIDYLNPIAESMTEWTLDEARGAPLETVFRIISEDTRQPAPNPVQRCLVEGRIVGLANHTALISRSGKEYSIQDSAAPIRERDGNMVGVIMVFNDVTQSRRMAREAEHFATHDDLTGLVNRREFGRRLDQAVRSSKQFGSQHALCYLDLDQFKVVNDTAGHKAGDVLLKELAVHLSREVRDRDSLARLGGDEFGLLLDNCPATKAAEIARLLVGSIRAFEFAWEDRKFEVGVSIGLVAIDASVGTSEELLTQADVACYAAKDLGGNRVHVYASDMEGSDPRHAAIIQAADMRAAVDEKRFRLFAQPIVSVVEENQNPTRHEVLLRMVNKEGSLINAGAFIPAAERYGLMGAIDRWVIRTVCSNYNQLCSKRPDPWLSINLSGNSLSDESLLKYVHSQFTEHNVDPNHICFEITETTAIRDIVGATRIVTGLRQIGCQFALDDFGTGLSSFAYLKSLPVDYIKIDGRFVRDIETDANDRAMVSAITQVAHTMGIRTIAEHAESNGCVEVLKSLGVDEAQGFALGFPEEMPIVD